MSRFDFGNVGKKTRWIYGKREYTKTTWVLFACVGVGYIKFFEINANIHNNMSASEKGVIQCEDIMSK